MTNPLVKIRSERDQMSAIERRIADFILDNAHLLRDYSSQQLANALGISQSSVVKFSQKLGFRGYPDLKYSVGAAVAVAGNGAVTAWPPVDVPASYPQGADDPRPATAAADQDRSGLGRNLQTQSGSRPAKCAWPG